GIRDKLVTGVQTCALPISHLLAGAGAPQLQLLVAAARQDVLAVRAVQGGRDDGLVALDFLLHLARIDVPDADGPVAPRRQHLARSEERRVGKEWKYGWGRA